MAIHGGCTHRAGMTMQHYSLIYDIVKNAPVYQVMRGSRLIYESDIFGDAERVAIELERALI